jgi:ABC-2 type transport system ATP-binding protein
MIKTQNLVKNFDGILAVDDLSFSVEPGEVLGFLGPNGAGKSTTMRMIAGFMTPTSGSASICGHDVVQEPIAARSALGYLPEGAPLYGEMTVGSFLGFIADLRGLEGVNRKTRLDYVIGRLQLEGVIAQSIDTLSKGFKRRVGLAQAIVHDPRVLILDEPTDGLDPLQKHEVRTLIGEIAKEKTIVISTHILEEVDAVCTRAVIIARGKIVADDTPAALRARTPSGRLDDVFRDVAA